MDHLSMNRRQLLANMGVRCLGSCVCAMNHGACGPKAPEEPAGEQERGERPRSQARIAFAEKWVVRFFNTIDSTLDEPTRNRLMEANGRACFREWVKDSGQKVNTRTLEELTASLQANPSDEIQIEGNVIRFTFLTAAETGLPSEEGACLCPLVESSPAALSSTYCRCSVGYVTEWYEQMLARPVKVELAESVLKGDKRCRFNITVL